MPGSRKTIGLVLLGCLALGLRVWVVMALRTGDDRPPAYEHAQIAESLLAVQLLQCVAGAALVLAVVWLAWLLVPEQPAVGWVAGLGAAVYPTHLHMVAHLEAAVWAALLLTLLLAVVISPKWRSSPRKAVLAGSLAGLLLLVEPLLALALPIAAAAFWMAEGAGNWRSRFRRAPLGRVALMAGAAAVIVAPWIVRNAVVHGEFVFVKSTFGYEFSQANHPAGLDRLRQLFLLDGTGPAAPGRIDRMATVTWLVLAAVGLMTTLGRWRSFWPTWAIFAAVTLFYVLFLAPVQARIPLEPMGFIWAAAAVAPVLVRMFSGQGIKVYRPGQQGRDPLADEAPAEPHYEAQPGRRAA